MITLFIYTIFIFFIFLKGIYFLIFSIQTNLPIKEKLGILNFFITLEMYDLIFLRNKIFLLSFLMSFFLLIIYSCNNIAQCQDVFDETYKSEHYFNHNTRIIKKDYKNCSDFYEELNEAFSKPRGSINLKKDELNDPLVNYKIFRLKRSITSIFTNPRTEKLELGLKILGKGTTEDDLVFSYSARPCEKYLAYFKKNVNSFSSYDISQTKNPYPNLHEISSFLYKSPIMCNNLAFSALKDKGSYISNSEYLKPEIPVYLNEISPLLKKELPSLYKQTYNYINNIFELIDKKASPHFYQDLIYISNMFKLSSQSIEILDDIIDQKGDLSFKKSLNKLNEFLYNEVDSDNSESSSMSSNSSDENKNESISEELESQNLTNLLIETSLENSSFVTRDDLNILPSLHAIDDDEDY